MICQCFAGDIDAWNSSSKFMPTLFPLFEQNNTSSQIIVVAVCVSTSLSICIFAIAVTVIKVRNQQIANEKDNGSGNGINVIKSKNRRE